MELCRILTIVQTERWGSIIVCSCCVSSGIQRCQLNYLSIIVAQSHFGHPATSYIHYKLTSLRTFVLPFLSFSWFTALNYNLPLCPFFFRLLFPFRHVFFFSYPHFCHSFLRPCLIRCKVVLPVVFVPHLVAACRRLNISLRMIILHSSGTTCVFRYCGLLYVTVCRGRAGSPVSN